MSSTERAPEPTMEDILASIRRIITDDETGPATAEKPDQKAQAEDETIEGEADNQIIDDIARVLGGSGETPGSEDEEILDLTAELGGLEVVEDEIQETVEVVEVAEAAEVLELEDVESMAAAPEPAELATPPAADIAAFDAGPQDVTPAPEPVPSEAPVPTQIPEPVASAPESAQAASEEAASALERAIAALKAGQVPASSETPVEPLQFESAPEPEPMATHDATSEDAMSQHEIEAITPQTIPMAVPMSEPAPEDETHPDPELPLVSEAEGNLEVELEAASPLEPLEDDSGAETELVLTEAGTEEMVVESEPEKSTFWPAEEGQDASLQEPSLQESSSSPEPEPEPVPEPAATASNGSGAHQDEGVSKTLEDSIKEMLRPMLRQWLDDNMPRMIREELDADALRRHQD